MFRRRPNLLPAECPILENQFGDRRVIAAAVYVAAGHQLITVIDHIDRRLRRCSVQQHPTEITSCQATGELQPLLLAVAAWRAGVVPLAALVVVTVFFVTNQVPVLPGGELIPLLIGLVGYSWIGWATTRPTQCRIRTCAVRAR